MKKFLFFLLFLIILGGTVFFLGWAQLTVPPGSFGVMRSKTHGLEREIIHDGEFRWIWYKAIPTNAEVYVFTVGPVRHYIRTTGSLPSGQVYAELAGLDADFSWEISGELGFNIRPEYLPEISGRENIRDDRALRGFEARLSARLESIVIQRLSEYAESEDDQIIESFIVASELPGLDSEILALIPEIENFYCRITLVRFPDFALYRSLQDLYHEYLAQQHAALSQDITREAERRIATRIRLDELAMYGDLLTRYPILLEFMALELETFP
ncbi:MAG: hypothetical protein FWH19_06275 [Treponema sp.]|nr:hypothetical protein [Treponema sp.]